ncbi:MAG TPA: gamma-glutamylcyclotransferase [Myxococcota bacterium]|nr:gamma-glutamylcyclotransferase [Myxococcota bacterium]
MAEAAWVFGYGSLVWRPAFPYAVRHPAYIRGWARRFWQGSPDHRGRPQALGRVATLVADPDAQCWGMAYLISPEAVEETLTGLDHRERGGYARLQVQMHAPAMPRALTGFTYLAEPTNPHFLGPAPLPEMAAQIERAWGDSGANRDYVLELATALRAMGVEDEHVFALAALLER